MFSKSFGYALRGVLYITFRQDESRFVQVDEVASSLAVPKHFMGKILKRLAKEKILTSSKGPNGGFSVNANTSSIPLIRLAEVTSDLDILKTCVLRFKECNGQNPCPMHSQMEEIRNKLTSVMAHTTIHDLMLNSDADFVGSISALKNHKNENA